jgi:hypothetical protein
MIYVLYIADIGGHVVQGVGLRPLAYWDVGFQFHGGHGGLPLMNVVFC